MKAIYTRAKLRAPVPAQTIVRNPRFFTAPEKGVETVYLNRDFPEVKAAYERAHIPVRDIADLPSAETAPVQLLRPEDQKPRGKR